MSSEPTQPTGPDPDPDPSAAPVGEVEITLDGESPAEFSYAAEVEELIAVQPTSPYSPLTRLGAEAAGTFALVLVVVATLLYDAASGLGSLGAALAAGLALAGLYAAFVHVSGAHLNPAVTLGSAITGRTGPFDAIAYVVAQLIGAAAAVAVVFATIPEQLATLTSYASTGDFLAKTANGWGAASPLSVVSTGQVEFGLVAALLVEVLGTAVLVGVVLATRPSARSAGAIGATYAAMLLLAAPITTGGFNPARSTAVALFTIGSDAPAMGQLWLFWVAPLIGGLVAGLAKLAFGRRQDTEIEEALEAAQDAGPAGA